MRDPGRAPPGSSWHRSGVRIERVRAVPAVASGGISTPRSAGAYHWVDRLPWTDDEIRAYLADPAVVALADDGRGAPAGYFELRRDAGDGIEIAYFGLLPSSPAAGSAGTC